MNLKTKIVIAICAFILSTTVFFACQKTDSNVDQYSGLSPTLKEFVNSKEFKRSVNSFPELGEIDIENSNFEIFKKDGHDFILLKVFFNKNNKLAGFIEAIKMNSKVKNLIPNDDRYLMTLIRYDDYDFQTRTGNVQLFDLNYDNFNYSSLFLENGSFKKRIVSKLSTEISSKYQSLKKKKDLHITGSHTQARIHFCDCKFLSC